MSGYINHLNQLSDPKTLDRKKDYIDYNLKKYIQESIVKKSQYLEIGPGYGEFESYLNDRKVYEIDIIDNDKSVISHVSKNFQVKNSYLTNNFLKIKNKLSSYNLIFLMQVLEHLPTDSFPEVVKVLYNHLVPGGYLIIIVPNGNNPLGIVERYGDLQHTTCFTEQSLKDLVSVSGTKNYTVEIKGYEIPPYNLINLIRILIQKMLHFCLLLIMIANGGVYFKTMTPNIMLIIKKNSLGK